METTDIEKKSLEAHVELCAERYRMLEHKLSDLEKDVCEVKETTGKTHSVVQKIADKNNDRLISWGIGIIGFLLSSLVYLLTHYVFTK